MITVSPPIRRSYGTCWKLLRMVLRPTNCNIWNFSSSLTFRWLKGALCKVNTDSKLLFDLVLRLHLIKISRMMWLHIVHVAGTRMITQGTDGLPQG